MPTFRDVTISLQSQYDALTIPEQISTSLPSIPTNASISSLDLSSTHSYTLHPPPASRSPVINVSIPTFPCSQFWINYSCEPPREDDETKFYYFKLFVSGKCILSWGVGEKEDWSGKTMYALFNAGTDFEGRRIVEKKGLFFPRRGRSVEGDGIGFEIRVFRAKARKREALKYETFVSLGLKNGGFDFANLGRVRKGERQRAYTYALLDPKDEPYVTFKYTIRNDGPEVESGNDLQSALSRSGSQQIEPYVLPPCSLLSSKSKGNGTGRSISIPPRKKLLPTGSRNGAASTDKDHATTLFADGTDDSTEICTSERSKPRDWLTRTPSPMVSRLFELPASPLPVSKAGKKTGSAALLKEVVANKFKKREVREWEMGKSFGF